MKVLGMIVGSIAVLAGLYAAISVSMIYWLAHALEEQEETEVNA